MLNHYGVKLTDSLQTKLDNHVVFTGRDYVYNTDDLQQEVDLPIDQLEHEPDITLRLNKLMTLKILLNIVYDLNLFLDPILEQLEFLVYFHLQRCAMFSKHLKSRIAKISTNELSQQSSKKKLQQVVNVVLLHIHISHD